MQDFGDVEGSVCIMLRIWDVQDMRFSGCEMLRCGILWCEILGMHNAQDVECFRCEMFEMWNVRDVKCLGCGMLKMWDV